MEETMIQISVGNGVRVWVNGTQIGEYAKADMSGDPRKTLYGFLQQDKPWADYQEFQHYFWSRAGPGGEYMRTKKDGERINDWLRDHVGKLTDEQVDALLGMVRE